MPPAKLGGIARPRNSRTEWIGPHLTPSVKELPKTVGLRNGSPADDQANSGIRREPELPQHEEVVPELAPVKPEFEFADEEPDDEVQRAVTLRRQAANIARQAAMDPDDGLGL
jgi:type IV secretion system protein VirD4